MRFDRLFVLAAIGCASIPAAAQDADELAKQLSNPLAAMISVPFQFNADLGYGPDGDGQNYTLKIQPVIPLQLSPDWNLISRTIVPVTGLVDIFDDDIYGFGDTTQSFFLSPTQPGPGGLIWGAGPVLLFPTATDGRLGTEKWGAGPTIVALVEKGPWTTGILANHIWSFVGDSDREDVSQTFLQPFVSYALGGGQTLSLNLESTYDWVADQWTLPVNLGYSKVFTVGGQAMSWQIGAKGYVVTPEGGPNWGVRSTLTFLFPTK